MAIAFQRLPLVNLELELSFSFKRLFLLVGAAGFIPTTAQSPGATAYQR
jgi:hypothetical protein